MAIDLNDLATAIGQLVLRFRLRRRTAADWVTSNEILLAQELGVETDSNKAKLGDGTTAWNDLSYWPPVAGVASIVAGANIAVDNTDPANPVVSATGGGGGSGGAYFNPPNAAQFTASPIGPVAPTLVDDATLGLLYETPATNGFYACLEPVSGSTWTLTARIKASFPSSAQFNGAGIIVVNAANTFCLAVFIDTRGSIFAAEYSTAGVFQSFNVSTSPWVFSSDVVLQIRLSSGTLFFDVGQNEKQFRNFGSRAVSALLGTVGYVGLTSSTSSSLQDIQIQVPYYAIV